ncbi:MAG: aspartyl/glutamyl-tRNA amidotransferase subunit C [Deltaproteobacteria bacterium]|nr:aspartyl/glutamyl-tRNA amidotransferase subunit C [Deltaproteobacteria bacterium]
MPIDLETLERAAAFARLEKNLAGLDEDMAGLLSAIDILNEADLGGVEPLYSPMTTEVHGLRPDEPGPGTGEFLSQAPALAGRFFAVPKII